MVACAQRFGHRNAPWRSKKVPKTALLPPASRGRPPDPFAPLMAAARAALWGAVGGAYLVGAPFLPPAGMLLTPFPVFGAAALLVPSLLLDEGVVAASRALPWVAVAGATVLIVGLEHISRRVWDPRAWPLWRPRSWLAVGAGATRTHAWAGPRSDPRADHRADAVHSHYAGFVTSLLAAQAFRHVQAGNRTAARSVARVAVALAVIAPPVVAAGFILKHPLPQIGGAALLTIGVYLLAALTLFSVAPQVEPAGAQILLAVSAISVVVPMVLAIFWAIAQHVEAPALSIPDMALVHGTTNALGWSLCGLLGWQKSTPR
jgi:hypothetical protein